MGDGYGYDPAGLERIVGQLRSAATPVNEVVGRQITAPDAGASSGAVGTALANLVSAAIGAASIAEVNAGAVDTAKGSYGAFENNAKGEITRQTVQGMKPYDDIMENYNGPM